MADAAAAEAVRPLAEGLGSFLTDSQRTALDAALAEKAAEHAIAARAAGHQKAMGDKKSKSGKGTGAAKKGGGGGRFTWGSVFTNGDHAERILDRNDPNYDSDEERTAVVVEQQSVLKKEVNWYKDEVKGIVEEYFASADIGEVSESLDDLGAPDLMHYFVKRLVMLSLDRKDREREMASVLLSSLYVEVLPAEQVQKGFVSLIDGLEDTVLDVPDAADLLATFIARAVVDDVLPPAVANKIPESPAPLAALKQKVDAFLHSRHSAEKILRCWGSGAGLNYQGTKDSITRILGEFATSRDADEAARCLRGLSVPFFHHELIKQAVHAAMDAGAGGLREALVGLVARLASTGEVSHMQLTKGLKRVADHLHDLCLDNPAAKEQYHAVLDLMRASNLSAEADAAAAAANGGREANGAGASTAAAAGGGGHSISAFKAASVVALREYFDSSDADEVARRLTELDEPGLLHIFVKNAIRLALDRKDRERELVSTLLASLYPKVISADQVANGFTRLLGATDDLVLDCPDAVHLLSLFLGRAVVDEVLPPSFLTQVLTSLRGESLGVSVVKALASLLASRHSSERLSNCWHGGALTLEQIKAQIKAALMEFITSRDVAEASKCLCDLGVPYYHHEVVVEAIELAFEKDASGDDLMLLLASLASTGVINQTQMTKGFSRLKNRIGEEALDFGPVAQDAFRGYVERATNEGWLVLEA